MAKIGKIYSRAMLDNATVNEEERTIEVVFATETPVLRMGWEENFNEVLSCAPGAMRMGRFQTGTVPVIDNHQRYEGVKGQLGAAFDAMVSDGSAKCKIKLSKRAELDGLWQDIKDGIVKGISAGYRVYKYEIERKPNSNELPIYRAVDWEPMEVSFAPIPADYYSTIRSEKEEESNDCILIDNLKNRSEMDPIELAEKERAAQQAKDDAAKAALELERKRSTEILNAVRTAGLDNEFAERMVTEGHDIAKVRELVISEMAARQAELIKNNQKPDIKVGKEHIEKVREGIELALMHRAGSVATLDDKAKPFRGMSLVRMAEEFLVAGNADIRGLNAMRIAERALSTSDFPIILGNTVNRTLRTAYEMAPRTFMPICRRGSAKDFKEMTRAQLSGLVESFDKIAEGGEYKAATMAEGKEAYKVAKYGKIIPITWETLVNDDMDAFSRIPTAIANKAAQKQSDIVWGIITANAAMSDGVALFHNTHGNLAGTAAAINTTSMPLARAAMRKQKGLEGDYINVNPKYLVVGPDKETEAQQLVQAIIMATKTADTNVFRGTLEIIVEPRLTGNQWYLIADPNAIDTIEYAFLDGEAELFTEVKNGFEVDGMQVKARMVFGAKAIDWRGMYKNAGA